MKLLNTKPANHSNLPGPADKAHAHAEHRVQLSMNSRFDRSLICRSGTPRSLMVDGRLGLHHSNPLYATFSGQARSRCVVLARRFFSQLLTSCWAEHEDSAKVTDHHRSGLQHAAAASLQRLSGQVTSCALPFSARTCWRTVWSFKIQVVVSWLQHLRAKEKPGPK